jgi:aspartyl-tRNA(Asn)/glutamyl-tRNA(Gln) amidotransferase subunit A
VSGPPLSRRDFLRGRAVLGARRSEELSSLAMAEAARQIAARGISPVDLMRAVLARIERLESRVGAFVTLLDREQCLELASEAEREIETGGYRGRLHGMPVGVKDTHYTEGIPTTARTPILDDFVPRYDATVVARLKAAGAIVIGKTNLPEWSFGGATPGTRNPWNLELDPGGSSGGSAVAVAAGMLMGATGGDTSGSVRLPASVCGVVGLKPTYGRVSRHGIIAISWSLDHVGPIAKCVEDAALLLGAIAGYDPRDRTSSRRAVPDYAARLQAGIHRWKIGVPAPALLEAYDRDTRNAFYEALQVFRDQGAMVHEVAMPRTFFASQACQRIIRIVEAAAYHRRYLRTAADYGPSSDVRLQTLAGSLLPAAAFVRAQQVRASFVRELRAVFSAIDVFVTPARETVGPPGPSGARPLNTMFNLSGFPAISIPAGFSTDPPGLPLGIQIAGRPFEEETILTAAYAYEQATDWHERRPEL